jgi:phosphoribosylanthranilate isomerase
MCQPENIRQVVALDIDWMGFIFYEKSPRAFRVDGTDDEVIRVTFTATSTRRIGVFVNASPEYMMETATRFQLDYLQLHGDESPELCHTLQKRGYAIIKAISVASDADLEWTKAYEGRVDYFLFDTKCKEYGGSGKQFDWSVLAAYQGETPFLLSGGIHPGSVEAVLQFHHPCFAGIDLNSGFETEPGLKDVSQLQTFIKQLKRQ